MKLNKIYYRHLAKSFVIIIVGLAIIFKGIYADMAVTDNYFVLLMGILSAFFALLGGTVLLMRFGNIKFRRKFMFTFFGVANFCIGGLSIFLALLHKTAGLLAIFLYLLSFLVGIVILADVFFGKRSPKKGETEMLIE